MRKPPKGKVHAEAKPGADPKSDANPSKEPIPEANPSQAQKPAPVEADQNPISATVEVSQVENPTQNSATVQVDQGLFDEIPDEIMATIADITMAEAPKQGKVKAEKGKVKPVKLYHVRIRSPLSSSSSIGNSSSVPPPSSGGVEIIYSNVSASAIIFARFGVTHLARFNFLAIIISRCLSHQFRFSFCRLRQRTCKGRASTTSL
ncbi:hypothetical protein P8452_25610 [Trifolium repens]|nr:hypothetical protein P8452_25610 [Trifolium repens]